MWKILSDDWPFLYFNTFTMTGMVILHRMYYICALHWCWLNTCLLVGTEKSDYAKTWATGLKSIEHTTVDQVSFKRSRLVASMLLLFSLDWFVKLRCFFQSCDPVLSNFKPDWIRVVYRCHFVIINMDRSIDNELYAT